MGISPPSRFAKIFRLVSIALPLASSGGCNKATTLQDGSQGTAPRATQAVSAAEIQAIFPHTEEFKGTGLHGKKFAENGATCRTCHGQDLSGAATKVSCASCHGIFPHSDDFRNKSHGSQFFKDPRVCANCHGTDFKGGDIGVACASCHNFPHEGGWALAANHGVHYVAEKAAPANPHRVWANCATCHSKQPGQSTPVSKISCDGCHTMIPHDDDFLAGGHKSIAVSYEGKCTICHTDFRRNMPGTTKGCADCHDGTLSSHAWVTPPVQASPSPTPASPSPSTDRVPGSSNTDANTQHQPLRRR